MADVAGSDFFTDVGGAAAASFFDSASDIPPTTRVALSGSRFLLAYSSRVYELRNRLQQLVGGDVVVWDPRPPAGFAQHITLHLSQPLRELGVPVNEWEPRITLRPEQEMHLEQNLGEDLMAIFRGREGERLVAVHPGGGGVHKCWPKQNFAALINELLRAGVQVVVLLGPVESEDKRDIGQLVFPGVYRISPETIAQLAAVLERVDLFVGNDSGPGHVAAAVGTPTVSLFGPTNPVVWKPLGPKAAVIASENRDIDSIPVAAVVRTVLRALEEL